MPHRRSEAAYRRRKVKRNVKHLILDSSYRDPEMAETICTITSSMTRLTASQKYPFRSYHEVLGFEPGDVLLDARGRGALQQILRSVQR